MIALDCYHSRSSHWG